MADPFASPEDPTLRYSEIEQAYRQERWSAVLAEGEALLRDLRERPDPASPGLIPRLRILLAHTHLYGLGDPWSAADHYRGVLESCQEETLRRTAEEGLQLCAAPGEVAVQESLRQEGTVGDGIEATRSEPEATLQASEPEAATPWSGAAGAAHGSGAGGAAGAGVAMPWLGADPQVAATSSDRPEAVSDPQPVTGFRPGRDIGVGATAVETTAAPSDASLIPEVVEEPELIEVHQNDPLLSEEIEARETSRADVLLIKEQDPEEEDRDLREGLLRVTISAGGGR